VLSKQIEGDFRHRNYRGKDEKGNRADDKSAYQCDACSVPQVPIDQQ